MIASRNCWVSIHLFPEGLPGLAAGKFLERMGALAHAEFRYAERPGDLAYIEIASRIHTEGMRGDEVSRGLPVRAAPVQEDIARKVQDPHTARQVILDRTVGERCLTGSPPQLGNVNPAFTIKGDVRGPLDMGPHFQKLSVSRIDMDAVVLTVRHEDTVIR